MVWNHLKTKIEEIQISKLNHFVNRHTLFPGTQGEKNQIKSIGSTNEVCTVRCF